MARDDDDDRPRPPRRRPRDDDDNVGPRSRRKQSSNLPMTLGIIVGVLLFGCFSSGFVIHYAFRKVGDNIREEMAEIEARNDVRSNLSKISIAFSQGDSAPTNSYKDGKPLLSWRVHLLPELEHEALYKQFKLDEPWDSEHNKKLLTSMPDEYNASDRKNKNQIMTPFRGVTSPRGAMGRALPKHDPQGRPPRNDFKVFTDMTSNVIFFFESDELVEWTKPDEIEWHDANDPRPLAIPRAGPNQPDTFRVVMGLGQVKKIDRRIDNLLLWRLFTRDDGFILPLNWDR